ncbi:MAG TPA: CARDB domain-containing protein, partial [Anaerolineales bacterium]|nr:CARDB domain-containing protein [Anaerolineales bacterium]
PGDKFQATVGCAYGAACNLTYRLDYMTASGYIGTFWTWREQNEGRVYNAKLDLGPLAGRSVRFILTILATGSATNDRALWGSPRIVRTGGGSTPTATATQTFTPLPNDWLKYTNPAYGFEFRYPPQAQIVEQSNNSLKMNLPFTPGTNLVEKYLQMSVNENVNPCQSPLSYLSRPGSPTETVVFNGISFLKQVGGDAGVGHLHEWVGYSTLKNNACISMDFVLHSLAPGNYSTPPPIFNKEAESAVFAQMMGTFGWTPATVTPVPPPVVIPSPKISKLFMIDASNGWAIDNAYILRTYDGGTTWYSVTAPGISTIRNAFFQNSNKGWVLTTDSIYRTLDGGATWVQHQVPFNGGYIQFLDDSNGFVLSGEGSGMHKHAVYLYQTSDGGATWMLKYANDPSQPNNTLPFSGLKYGMTFRDTSTGWVGGYVPSPGAVYLYKTTNGGTSWAQQSLALPAGYESADITITSPTFFGSNDGILPVWASGGAGSALFIYVTHDGGGTWTRTGSIPSQGSRGVDFISMNDGFAWNGSLQVTHNSGANWSQVTPNVSLGDYVPYMDFVSTMNGWILQYELAGSSPLYRTMDGGSTWTLVSGSAAPTAPPSQLPDLAIIQMRIELQNTSCLAPGDPTGVRISVTNSGQTAAGSFVVRVNDVDQTVNALGIGETTSLFFPGYSNPVTALLDPTGTVAESNENNNSRAETLPIPTPPLPCDTPTSPPANPSAAEFAQTIVNALNTKDFGAAKGRMGGSFAMSFWQSQGT